MQLKREAKLSTVIGLITKHADCRITLLLYPIISNTFVTHDYFSELIGKVSPTNIFFSIYRPSHHKIPVPIGPVAKEILIRP